MEVDRFVANDYKNFAAGACPLRSRKKDNYLKVLDKTSSQIL